MFNYGDVLDLPLIWGGLIALSVFIYVLLDGFDLGCGILFPFAGSDKNRSRIMISIAPFWGVSIFSFGGVKNPFWGVFWNPFCWCFGYFCMFFQNSFWEVLRGPRSPGA